MMHYFTSQRHISAQTERNFKDQRNIMAIPSSYKGFKILLSRWCCSGVFIVNIEHLSHLFSSVSVVDCEQINELYCVKFSWR